MDEFKSDSVYFRQSGFSIPMGVHNSESVTSMCPLRLKNEKIIFVHRVKSSSVDSRIKCVGFNGQILWEIGDSSGIIVDGAEFVPKDLCKDDKRNVFVTDMRYNRVALLDTGKTTLRPILTTAGSVVSIAYRATTGHSFMYCITI